jgi:WD40 repeat protein
MIPGTLIRFNSARAIDKSTDLTLAHASSLALNDTHVACGGSDGVIHLLRLDSLEFVCALPLPPSLMSNFSSLEENIPEADSPASSTIRPAVIALGLDMSSDLLSCLYSDRMLIVWQQKLPGQFMELRRFSCHASSVTSLDCDAGVSSLSSNCISSTFISGSSDSTLRWWTYDPSNGWLSACMLVTLC